MRPRLLPALALAAASVLGVNAPAAASPAGHHHPHHQESDHTLSLRQLIALWRSTARYHHVDAALASGRVDLSLCFDQMGEHYADPATFSDGILDPIRPEALVYEHVGNRLRLVAVEWVSATPGEVLGIPLHLNENLGVWVLHAWVWKFNPDGLLADFNPRVGDCPAP